MATRGRPRSVTGKEYVKITRRKRKDGNFDVLQVTSVYDPETQNNKPIRSKKLGITLAGYTDLVKEMFPMGSPEAKAITAMARKNGAKKKAKPQEAPAVSESIEAIADPRQEGKVAFPMRIVVMVMILAGLTGAVSTYQVAQFWKTFRPILQILFPDFPKEDISHDTIRRITQVLGRSEDESFIEAVTRPLIKESKKRRHISIDGQAVRAARVHETDKAPYIFNAYDVSNGLVLSQKLIGDKKNEISEALGLIEKLDLRGCILTADALNTQKAFAKQLILEKKCDYCLALKDNHRGISKEVRDLFELEPTDIQRRGHPAISQWKSQRSENLDKGHGRLEERSVRVLPGSLLDKDTLKEWEGLEEGILIEAVTKATELATNKESIETRYFISSLTSEKSEDIASDVMTLIRNHWGIENRLHWVLDATFLQDRTQCTNAEFLVGRTRLMKVVHNLMTSFQKMDEEAGEKPLSRPAMKVRCQDIEQTFDRLCQLYSEM